MNKDMYISRLSPSAIRRVGLLLTLVCLFFIAFTVVTIAVAAPRPQATAPQQSSSDRPRYAYVAQGSVAAADSPSQVNVLPSFARQNTATPVVVPAVSSSTVPVQPPAAATNPAHPATISAPAVNHSVAQVAETPVAKRPHPMNSLPSIVNIHLLGERALIPGSK